MKISGKTKVLGIIGHPVEHSLSPAMQNAALAALGLDYIYVPFPVAPEGLGPAVEGLRQLGVWGFNVTIPHKTAIMPFLDGISPEADLCGAVNTVRREDGRFIGYNTDGIGFIASVRGDLGKDPRGATVVVLGAGGAARGAVAALAAAGAARIIVANRTRERGVALVEKVKKAFPTVNFVLSSLTADEVAGYLSQADIVVNTTSVGMDGTSFECLDTLVLRSAAVVYDMVYAPAETPLLAAARTQGLTCANGLGMLAAQGEAAFALWTGVNAPPGVMKQKLLQMLNG
jgi:shikimate dehydrogenase